MTAEQTTTTPADPKAWAIGAVRTGVPMTWTAFLVYVLRRVFHIELNSDDLVALSFLMGPITAVFYLVYRWAEQRWPGVAGRILFGIPKAPTYATFAGTPLPPPPPPS